MKVNTKPLNKSHVLLLPYTQSVILSVASEFSYLDLVSNKIKKSEKRHFSAVRISISVN
jgi:hypothetical protein